jgi:hypothetical protein
LLGGCWHAICDDADVRMDNNIHTYTVRPAGFYRNPVYDLTKPREEDTLTGIRLSETEREMDTDEIRLVAGGRAGGRVGFKRWFWQRERARMRMMMREKTQQPNTRISGESKKTAALTKIKSRVGRQKDTATI